MALKAGYVGVKRWLYEKLQATAAQNVKGISDLKEGQSLLGAVNNLNITASTTTSNNVTLTANSDGSFSVETTAAGASATTFFPLESYKARTGQKIYVKGCPAGGGMTNYCLQIRAQDQSSVGIEDGSGRWFEFDSDDNALYALGIRINTGAKITTPIKFYPVLTLTDLDYPFATFAMTNQQLTNTAFMKKGDLSSSDDLHNITEPGIYGITSQPANSPDAYCTLIVYKRSDGGISQLIIKSGLLYTCSYGGSPAAWTSWYKYTGTAVTQAKAPTDDPELSVEEPETVTKTTRKTTKKEDN